MTISVIIPNYNHAAYLTQRIDSVIHQSFDDFEIIILDDCSTDNSRNIIEKYRTHSRVAAIIYADKNSGSPFLQWKKGIEASSGNWIWIAESDDTASPDFLQIAIDTIHQHPATALFYCDAHIIDEKGQPQTPSKYSSIKNSFFATDKWNTAYSNNGTRELNENLKFACTINNASSAVFKKELFLQFLDELKTYQYHGDWFSYIKTALKGDVAYTPLCLSSVRLHNESLLNKNKSLVKSNTEHFRILLLLLQQNEISERTKLIQLFSEQFLGFGFLKTGFRDSARIVVSYLSINFFTGINVLYRIALIKLTRKKITPVF